MRAHFCLHFSAKGLLIIKAPECCYLYLINTKRKGRSRMRGVYTNKRILDKGELTQLMIIIAGLAIAAVVTIGAISSVMLNKGESAAGCISESSGFKSGSDSARECRNMEEEAKVSSSGVIAGSFGSAAESEAATSRSQKISKQKEDFVELSKLLEEFKKKNGRYPVLNDETKSLN